MSSAYAYDVIYCHNMRQLGKTVNRLKFTKPQKACNATYTLRDFDLYDSCFDDKGFLNSEMVLDKLNTLLEDTAFPDFPFHAIALLGAAGSGKSTSVQYLNTYLGYATYCAFTNSGTDNINAKLSYNQSKHFGTLLSNMRMRKPYPTFEQGMVVNPKNFKEAQLSSLAYDWYNVSAMKNNIKQDLPTYVPFKGEKQEEDNYLWMISSQFYAKDKSHIPQIAISDAIIIDESGMCGFEKLTSLAFLIYLVRCYFQVKLDQFPVFILIGSVSQSYATKSIPDDYNTGLYKMVKTKSILEYLFKTPVVHECSGIGEEGRLLAFIKNKRCRMKFLTPLLAGLELGRNLRSQAHLLDSIVVPRETLTNPMIENMSSTAENKFTVSERLSTTDIDLSNFVRIAVGHSVLSEYRAQCYKMLPSVGYPVYVVVMLNEIRRFCQGKEVFSYLDDWLNKTNNDLGNYSQFRETLTGRFQRISDVVTMQKEFWPPLEMRQRPCAFKCPLLQEDIPVMKGLSVKENIKLVLYRSNTRLLLLRPVVAQVKSKFFITGYKGRLADFMENIFNSPTLFSSQTFAITILKSAVLHLRCKVQNLDADMEEESDLSDDVLMSMAEAQDDYSFVTYLQIDSASDTQLNLAISKALDVLAKQFEEVKRLNPDAGDEVVYFYTKDVWKSGNSAVNSIMQRDLMHSYIGIGSRLKFIGIRDFPEPLSTHAGFLYDKHKNMFPQMKRQTLLALNEDGFIGLLCATQNVYEIFQTEQRCTYRPLVSYSSPVSDQVAMTVTKSQGLTIPRVAGIVDDYITMEQFNVMLSRAEKDLVISKNILLNDKFRYKPNQIMYDILTSKHTRIIL